MGAKEIIKIIPGGINKKDDNPFKILSNRYVDGKTIWSKIDSASKGDFDNFVAGDEVVIYASYVEFKNKKYFFKKVAKLELTKLKKRIVAKTNIETPYAIDKKKIGEITKEMKKYYDWDITKGYSDLNMNQVLYGKLSYSKGKNIPGTFIAKGLKGYFNKYKKFGYKNTVIVEKSRSGYYALGFFDRNGNLKIATYTSPGIDGKRQPPYKKEIEAYRKIDGKKSYKHINHKSSKGGSWMPYSVRIKGPYAIHYGKTTGGPLSSGCFRIPMFYAKGFYDLISDHEKYTVIYKG